MLPRSTHCPPGMQHAPRCFPGDSAPLVQAVPPPMPPRCPVPWPHLSSSVAPSRELPRWGPSRLRVSMGLSGAQPSPHRASVVMEGVSVEVGATKGLARLNCWQEGQVEGTFKTWAIDTPRPRHQGKTNPSSSSSSHALGASTLLPRTKILLSWGYINTPTFLPKGSYSSSTPIWVLTPPTTLFPGANTLPCHHPKHK